MSCIVLHGCELYCVVLYGIVYAHMVDKCIVVDYCMVVLRIVLYCTYGMVLYCIVMYYVA